MPTYEYKCTSCDHRLEQFQPITAKPLRKCPQCGQPKLKRLIGAGAGIIFKGSGFYETDYRSENYKKDAKADKDAATPSPKGSSDSDKTSSAPSGKAGSDTSKSTKPPADGSSGSGNASGSKKKQ